MAGKEIKQRIVLEGEKQYNQAIKEAQRNLKTLKSELKAETAELSKNATEEQKAETKAKSLQKQIAEQEKVVKTLREALEAAKKEYADNEDVIQKWEQKLNSARETLGNMKSELDGVGGGLNGLREDANAATVATKSVADALGQIGSAGDSVAGAIEGIFSSVIDVVRDATVELWDMISETAARANNWTDIAAYWNTDPQTIQQYARAVGSVGKNFEDLQSTVTKLVLGGKGQKISEMIGISDANYRNEWDYAMAIMNELYTMRERGDNMTPIFEEIFGAKKATSVMDLLNDWQTIQSLLQTFNGNETGYGMSDKELATMDELYVKIKTIEEKWQAIKDNFAAGFGQVSLDLLVNVEGTLDGIADYLNATDEEGKQAALEKIRTNVEEFFRKLGEIIREAIGIMKEVGLSLSESQDPLTSAIGDILVKLSETLQWMVEHQNEVKTAFEAIFGFWLLAKLGSVAGKLSSILMQIETIKAFKGLGSAASAAEAAGASAGGSWAAGFGTAVMKALPWLAGLLVLTDTSNHASSEGSANGLYQDATGGLNGRSEYAADAVTMLKNRYGLTDQDIAGAEGLDELINGMDGVTLQKLDELMESRYGWEAPYEKTVTTPTGSGEGGPESMGGELVHRNRQNTKDFNSWMEEREEVTSTDVTDAADKIVEQLREGDDTQGRLIDNIWNSKYWQGGSADNNGITASDLANLKGLPAQITTAVENGAAAGAAAGVGNIQVQLDGATVGRLVAPYVSQIIASQIMFARNR